MEMLNEAIEGADAFKKMMEQVVAPERPTRRTEILAQRRDGENRQQRRARERAEKKARAKATAHAD